MKSVLINTIEKNINRLLLLDPETPKRLQQLQGKIVTIELKGLQWIFQAVFTQEGITIATDNFQAADTIVKGSPLSLLRMSLSSNNRNSFFAEDLVIEGDLELGQQVIALFDQLEIDWDEIASYWLGDFATYHLGRFTRKIKNIRKEVSQLFLGQVNEYLHEEIKLFPSREALNDFFTDVDQLRMKLDLLAARVEHLQKEVTR